MCYILLLINELIIEFEEVEEKRTKN